MDEGDLLCIVMDLAVTRAQVLLDLSRHLLKQQAILVPCVVSTRRPGRHRLRFFHVVHPVAVTEAVRRRSLHDISFTRVSMVSCQLPVEVLHAENHVAVSFGVAGAHWYSSTTLVHRLVIYVSV